MDNLKPLKSFLSDLITPIVKTAVGEAIPEAIKDKEKNLVPVQKISLPIIPLRSFLEKSPKEQNLVRAARAIKDSKKKQLLIHKKLPAIVIPIKVWSRDFSLPYSKLVKEYNALILLEFPCSQDTETLMTPSFHLAYEQQHNGRKRRRARHWRLAGPTSINTPVEAGGLSVIRIKLQRLMTAC